MLRIYTPETGNTANREMQNFQLLSPRVPGFNRGRSILGR